VAIDAGTIYSSIELRTGQLSQGIGNASNLLSGFVKNAKLSAGTIGNVFSTAFGVIAKGAAVIAGLTFALKAAAGPFAGFEQSIANVQSVTRATSEEFNLLEQAARDAGETTRFKASQAADALYFLGSAGLSAKQSVDALNGVLQLAGATQADLAFTSETVASTLSQFELQAGEATRVSNVFAAAIQNSQATMDKLANAMRQVGPVASGLGLSLEETTGALQILFNAGFRGQQAGRALKSALADLASPTANVRENFNKLNISLNSVNPTTNSLTEIIDTLSKSGITTAQTIDTFGKVAGPQLAVLISKGREELEKYTDAVTGTNAAAESYAIQNDTLAGDLDKLGSRAESVAISFAEQYSPALRQVIQNLTELLGTIQPVIDIVGQLSSVFLQFVGGALNVLNDLAGETITFVQTQIALNQTIERQETAFESNGKEIARLQDRYRRLKNQQAEGADVNFELQETIKDLNALLPKTNKLVATHATSYEELTKQLQAAEKATARLALVEQQKQLRTQLQLVTDEFVKQERKSSKLLFEITKRQASAFERATFAANLEKRRRDLEGFFKEQLENGEITREQIEQVASAPYNVAELATIKKELEDTNRTRTKAIEIEDKLDQVVKDLKKSYEEIADVPVSLPGVESGDEEDTKFVDNLEDSLNSAENLWDEYNKELEKGFKFRTAKDKESIEEMLANINKLVNQAKNIASDFGNALIDLSKATTDRQIANLERERDARIRAAGVAEQTEKKRLQTELDAAIAAGDEQTADEKRQELERLRINTEFEKKAAQLKYKAALAEWGIKVTLAIADTAAAVVKALPNIPLSIIAGITGGIQTAAIIAAKPDPPKFQTGGIVPGVGTGDKTMIAATPGERVLTSEDQRILTEILKSGTVGNGEGAGMNITIVWKQNDEELARRVVSVVNNGIVTIDQDRGIR
jgi:TP901 family phage tail tape measure protein